MWCRRPLCPITQGPFSLTFLVSCVLPLRTTSDWTHSLFLKFYLSVAPVPCLWRLGVSVQFLKQKGKEGSLLCSTTSPGVNLYISFVKTTFSVGVNITSVVLPPPYTYICAINPSIISSFTLYTTIETESQSLQHFVCLDSINVLL